MIISRVLMFLRKKCHIVYVTIEITATLSSKADEEGAGGEGEDGSVDVVAQEIGKRWAALDPEDKAHWKEQEARDGEKVRKQ